MICVSTTAYHHAVILIAPLAVLMIVVHAVHAVAIAKDQKRPKHRVAGALDQQYQMVLALVV